MLMEPVGQHLDSNEFSFKTATMLYSFAGGSSILTTNNGKPFSAMKKI
jgi:hypothetical protein